MAGLRNWLLRRRGAARERFVASVASPRLFPPPVPEPAPMPLLNTPTPLPFSPLLPLVCRFGRGRRARRAIEQLHIVREETKADASVGVGKARGGAANR